MNNPANFDEQLAGDNRPTIIAPAWIDPITGATYVHGDLHKERDSYEVPPTRVTETLGDVPSWVEYVQRYHGTLEHGGDKEMFLTWNKGGLRAVLDYHTDTPGRAQWIALHPFKPSRQFTEWCDFADGTGESHRRAIEFLEDHAPDIFEPPAADVSALLRSLRANVKAAAETILNPDGTSTVRFEKSSTVAAANEAPLPAEMTIQIPVLAGETETWKLPVRIRTSTDDNAHLVLRLSIPLADQAFEQAISARVSAAKVALDGLSVLRTAD